MNVIDQKITSYKVVKENDDDQQTIEQTIKTRIEMHEAIKRTETLDGTTYKIKTPQSEHALYITINDMVLDGVKYPYEIFINSKNMEHFQWVLALTRLISAIWRKGGDACFLVDELKSVFDPKGGYYKKGGVYMPSLVAEIGYTIEKHLQKLGMIESGLKEELKTFIEDKKKELEVEGDNYPENAVLCPKCNVKAAIVMDNCLTCLNCGDSKCG